MANEQSNEIRKSIFILKSNPMALQGAENFLRSRGWEVYAATTLQDAIPLILTKQPEYLLLCANHPQKKVKQLPKVLHQALTVKLMVYVDIASTLNISYMNEMGISNQLLPPVSGPAIERAVFKYEKEDAARLEEQKKYSANEALGKYLLPKAKSDIDIQQALNQFIDNANDSDDETSSPQSEYETFSEYEDRMKREADARLQNSKNSDPTHNNQNKSEFNAIGTGSHSNNSLNGNNSNGVFSSESIKGANTNNSNNNLKKVDSIIVKGAQHALDSTVVSSSSKGQPVEKISTAQNCLCIVIDSTRFQGYLIAALGKNRRFDDEFILNIQNKLFEFLKKQGEQLDDEGALEIKIKPVEFESWALEQADFLKKSVHNGDEVAMAFFPTPKTAPEVKESAKEDMLSINIDDLQGDIQVLFDVYVYLPANDRYILYTPKGGMFFSNQKDRLKNKGVSQMHMKKDDLAEAKKYQAQNYLNNKIEEFEQKAEDQKEKKKA